MSQKKTRDSALVDQALIKRVAERQAHLDLAKDSIMRAGHMLAQAFERVQSGQYHLDDVIVLCAVSSKATQAAARISQALKGDSVEEASAEEQRTILVEG